MTRTEKLISKMKEMVGEAHLLKDSDQLQSFRIDGRRPKVVVYPATPEEVSKIVAYAFDQTLTIIPMGNGTKIEIGNIPKKVDILLSTLRLNRITDCDCDNLTLTAESGITLREVQKRLAKEGRGYFIPMDPPFTEKATLGGIVATNSSGPRRYMYGTARDLVIGTKAVFPNGDIVVSGGKTVKNVSGYDMSKLLIGSYGTLGILCEMTFKLLPIPEKEATLLIPFVRWEDGDAFVQEVIGSQLLPSSIETLNRSAVKRLNYPVSLPREANYLIAIGLDGVEESIEREISELTERGKKYQSLDPWALHSEEHQSFWSALRDFAGSLKEGRTSFLSFKSNVLISKGGEVMKSYEEMINQRGMEGAFISHSGNGILYSYLFPGRNLRSKMESLIELIQKLTSEAVKNEGNMIVESAPSILKKRISVWGETRPEYQVMRRLKEQIDPKGILSPGRFLGGI